MNFVPQTTPNRISPSEILFEDEFRYINTKKAPFAQDMEPPHLSQLAPLLPNKKRV